MQELCEDVWTWRVWRPGSFRGVSFNGFFLRAGEERIAIDPPPLNEWDREHLQALGGVTQILITNANHLRGAEALREWSGAPIRVPAADRAQLACEVQEGYASGARCGPLVALTLADQKTPGESVWHWPERRLLILGDALIGTPGGALSMLPAAKFASLERARAGLRALLELDVEQILCADGESILRQGARALRRALLSLEEVPLEEEAGGLLPAAEREGWFVTNLASCAWQEHPDFGSWANLEGQRGRFRDLGVNVSVLQANQPACLYHREEAQEGFLVLSGRPRVLIEEQERQLEPWDYVHCPPGTRHVFLGPQEGAAAILMLGARPPLAGGVHYPLSELARGYGAAARAATDSPPEAYAGRERPQPLPSPWPLSEA